MSSKQSPHSVPHSVSAVMPVANRSDRSVTAPQSVSDDTGMSGTWQTNVSSETTPFVSRPVSNAAIPP